MNLKKFVNRTVDKMTLSYLERHLKEAFDEVNAIPTTVLAIIAENSYNEYNLKTIGNFLEKSFKTDMKEWRKYRNLMKIIDYILKYASSESINAIKKFQSEIRMLQNYNMVEAGVDKGVVVREQVVIIMKMLTNPRELDIIREQCRRDKEKYTGISSAPSQNFNNYNGYDSRYMGIGPESYSSQSYSNDYKVSSFSNENDRGNYKSPTIYSENYNIHDRTQGGYKEEEVKDLSNQYVQPTIKQDIFSSGRTSNEVSSGRNSGNSYSKITSSGVNDIFFIEQKKNQDIGLSVTSQVHQNKPRNLYLDAGNIENRTQSNELMQGVVPSIASHPEPKNAKQGVKDIFAVSEGPKDIFKQSERPQENVQKLAEKPKDLFVVNPNLDNKQKKAQDLFGFPQNPKEPPSGQEKKPDIFTSGLHQGHTKNEIFSIGKIHEKHSDIFSLNKTEAKKSEILSLGKTDEKKEDIFTIHKTKDENLDPITTHMIKTENPDIFFTHKAKAENSDIFITHKTKAKNADIFTTQKTNAENADIFTAHKAKPENPDIFTTHKTEEKRTDIFTANKAEEKRGDIFMIGKTENKKVDIFTIDQSGEKKTDIFTANLTENKNQHLLTLNKSDNKKVDIFTTKITEGRKVDIFSTNESEGKKTDIFAENLNENKNPNLLTIKKPDEKKGEVFTTNSKEGKKVDIFYTNESEGKKADIFASNLNENKNSNLLTIKKSDEQKGGIFTTNTKEGKKADIFSTNKLEMKSRDIFSISNPEEKNPDIITTNKADIKSSDILKRSIPEEEKKLSIFHSANSENKKIDIFTTKKPQENFSSNPSSTKLEEKKNDIFSLNKQSENKISSPHPNKTNEKSFDIFSLSKTVNKILPATEIQPKPTQPVFEYYSQVPNSQKIIESNPSIKQKNSMFSGMISKKTQEIINVPKVEISQNELSNKIAQLGDFDLASLNLNLDIEKNSGPNTKPQEKKFRFNYVESEPAPQQHMKKQLTPEELEAKLLNLEF